MTRPSTTTLIAALRTLARGIQSDDGVANAVIAEAADRLEEQHRDFTVLLPAIEAMAEAAERLAAEARA